LYKIPVDTLFLGKNLVVLPECPSTNTLAAEMSQSGQAGEGTVIITHHQTSGRGQRGNTWESGKGLNLTFSTILHPVFLRVSDQFLLNKAVALAVHDVVKIYTENPVRVKWPNDIMIGDKKVCGILIENQLTGEKLSRSIVGIGLNVNQREFPVPTASSVSVEGGKEINLVEMFDRLLRSLEWRFLQIRSQESGGRRQEVDRDYLQAMYRINSIGRFTIRDMETDGIIKGVDATGKLIVEIDNAPQTFDLKEIKYIM
jgi:BirA family biotin operon repressor/biotin-[acetyl-CoA-carboxylase] ligase